MNKIKKLAVPALLMMWATVYFLQVWKLSAENQLLIKPVYSILVILFVYNTIKTLKKPVAEEKKKEPMDKKVLIVIAMCIAFIALLSPIGFLVTSICFILGILLLFKVSDKRLLIGLPTVISGVLYYVFVYCFNVPLPKGILPFL